MINKLLYILRYIIQIKFNKRITTKSFVVIQKNVRLIIEEGGEIVFGENVIIKEKSVIYAKKNAKIIWHPPQPPKSSAHLK